MPAKHIQRASEKHQKRDRAGYLLLRLALQCLNKLFGRLLSVSLWIVLGPPPQIGAGIFECKLCFPAKLFVGAGRVGSQIENITSSSAYDFIGELAAHGIGEGVDHIVDGAALAGTQVPGTHAGMFGSEVVQGDEVTLGEIENVDVVANGRAVFGIVVYWLLEWSNWASG